MSFQQSNGQLPQLTGTGNSDPIDITDAVSVLVTLRHDNGSGSVSTPATVRAMLSHDGTNFYPDTDLGFSFGGTAGAVEHRTYSPPQDGQPLKALRFDYTAPTGPTGATLDVIWSALERSE